MNREDVHNKKGFENKVVLGVKPDPSCKASFRYNLTLEIKVTKAIHNRLSDQAVLSYKFPGE